MELNTGWRFHRGEEAGAERPAFDDSSWHVVSVPHDWSIDDLPGQSNPFDKNAPGGAAVAYTDGGVGWYRLTLDLLPDVRSRSVLLRFGAVYMNAEIWVNGQSVGQHAYGYTPFTLDISDTVRPGSNLVAVRVDNEQPSSRWYSGSGILRRVYLDLLDKVHIDPDGPTITTPDISSDKATVRTATVVTNALGASARVQLISAVVDASGHEVRRTESARTIVGGASLDIVQEQTLDRPALWSPDTPNLYHLVQEVRLDGRVVDRRETSFGVRSVAFDAEHGLRINGKRYLLRGGAIHSDNYMLGGVSLPRADERKLELMKAAGYNAVRSAHNPASQGLLDAADRLGMLVIDEAFDAWTVAKQKNDYSRYFKPDWRSDIASMIASGRNHPSVILWSIGNEIPELTKPAGSDEARELAGLIHKLDPTRPVTAAVNQFGPGAADFIKALDVVGYNYYPERYGPDHAAHPDRVMYGSESFSAQAFDYWTSGEAMPWVVGDFVWTGFDYLGEAGIGWTGFNSHFGIGPYPWQLAMAGEIDATGRLRPAAFYREVLWKTHITPTSAFVEWPGSVGSLPDKASGGPLALTNWVQDDLHPVWHAFGLPADYMPHKIVVFSEDDEVELFLNGRSLGRKPVSKATEYRAVFYARFEPGELKAVGYVDGKPVSQWTLQTAGPPAAIHLRVDRARINADGDDLAYVTVELVDAKGRPTYMPESDRPLTFKVEGAGVLAGVGNGDPTALESFQSGKRSTFHGRAVAVVRAGRRPGAIRIEVFGAGLTPATVTVLAEGRRARRAGALVDHSTSGVAEAGQTPRSIT
ncbi:MAG TPA: glycoside hydrolase family 2 TIM barrel-domain containing protein [Pseudolabrys sp.]|nr:glycoside hydrolase family 2 TIM barrel-domain containing protein [Pseudolabrys sp.]